MTHLALSLDFFDELIASRGSILHVDPLHDLALDRLQLRWLLVLAWVDDFWLHVLRIAHQPHVLVLCLRLWLGQFFLLFFLLDWLRCLFNYIIRGLLKFECRPRLFTELELPWVRVALIV